MCDTVYSTCIGQSIKKKNSKVGPCETYPITIYGLKIESRSMRRLKVERRTIILCGLKLISVTFNVCISYLQI